MCTLLVYIIQFYIFTLNNGNFNLKNGKNCITTKAHIFIRDGQKRWFRTKVKAGHGDM